MVPRCQIELTLTMDTSPQVIKIDEVHGIAVGDARMGRHAVVARKHGLGHTEHRDCQRYESSAHDRRGVRSSESYKRMRKVGLVPPSLTILCLCLEYAIS